MPCMGSLASVPGGVREGSRGRERERERGRERGVERGVERGEIIVSLACRSEMGKHAVEEFGDLGRPQIELTSWHPAGDMNPRRVLWACHMREASPRIEVISRPCAKRGFVGNFPLPRGLPHATDATRPLWRGKNTKSCFGVNEGSAYFRGNHLSNTNTTCITQPIFERGDKSCSES